jgi:hypothetical protein
MRSRAEEKEVRLDALREEALSDGKVGAAGIRPEGAPFPVANAENGYYGRPLLKQPPWKPEVPLYFFVGGAAGASAVVGAAARISGSGDELVRDARWIAAVGAGVSSALLVSDLGRPERFLNMLRVFKPQSPMSVGAWTLTAFGSASAATCFAGLARRRYPDSVPVRIIENASEALAAATGLVMTSYTGVLIGATVVPVWNKSSRILPVHFAASGVASAVALLELCGHRHAALNRLGIAAAATETCIGAWHELSKDAALEPLSRGKSGAMVRTGGALSGPISLALRLMGKRRAAGIAALTGSILTRYGWVEAGKSSAADPRISLQLGTKAEDARGRAPREITRSPRVERVPRR